MSPRAAITTVFFVNGSLFATWASRIPVLSDQAGTAALGPVAYAVFSIGMAAGRLLADRL